MKNANANTPIPDATNYTDFSTDIQKDYIDRIAILSRKRKICRRKKRAFGYTAKVTIFLSLILLATRLIIKAATGEDKHGFTFASMLSIIVCIVTCYASEQEMKKENKHITAISFLEGAIDSTDKI
ncbi:MAG: hypothetical protein IKU43_03065 [Clostridia bacterium]|nr:hypothetical protein [Clostridia bacterium]